MDTSNARSHDSKEFLSLADETPVKGNFREWLADQHSPEKSRDDRKRNNREEFKELRLNWRFFVYPLLGNLVAYLMLRFLGHLGLILTVTIFSTLLIVVVFLCLRSARRALSNRIRANKSKFLRIKSEALALLDLVPEGTEDDDVLEALNELDLESKSLNNLDKTFFGFGSKALTIGPLALLGLLYLLNLSTSADPRVFIESHQTLGKALGYFIAMGIVISFVNEFIVSTRTAKSERISLTIALAREIFLKRVKLAAESNPQVSDQVKPGSLIDEPQDSLARVPSESEAQSVQPVQLRVDGVQ